MKRNFEHYLAAPSATERRIMSKIIDALTRKGIIQPHEKGFWGCVLEIGFAAVVVLTLMFGIALIGSYVE
jgi:hypothetical protein